MVSRSHYDFPGGIYLPPLGAVPPTDRIVPVTYPGELLLPLTIGGSPALQPLVAPGRQVARHELLATDGHGRFLYAPREGIIGPQRTATVDTYLAQPVLTLLTPTGDQSSASPASAGQTSATASLPDITPADLTCAPDYSVIERTGLIDPRTAQPFIHALRRAAQRSTQVVIGVAVPPEPMLNKPLALLNTSLSWICAGLTLLKQWLHAPEALLACPEHFPLYPAALAPWPVRLAAVSTKYPQAHPALLLETLKNRGCITIHRPHDAFIVDLLLVYQLASAAVSRQLPTHRVVTIAGDAAPGPSHFLAPVGLPLSVLLDLAGGRPDAACVVADSTMTGSALDPATAVVSACSQSFIVLRHCPTRQPERCIRCGFCVDYCPARLDPARLLHLAELGRYRAAAELHPEECAQCGICSYICPSQLPLAESIHLIRRKLRLHHPLPDLPGP